ncbi:MAG: hypothetical protein GY931_15520 [Maribacter sp.]|nr:hypothetical protein [Maribacter sp.]
MAKEFDINKIRLDGVRLCLNFINTLHDRIEEPKQDYLSSLDYLIQWAFKAGSINLDVKKELQEVLNSKNINGKGFLRKAIQLRELLHRIFISIINDEKISKQDLDKFNGILGIYFSKLQLNLCGRTFEEGWNLPIDHPNQIIAPIVKDSYLLITEGRLDRIKECPKCGWLFYDVSKNGKRKWCSMEVCGSRAKALDWYRRQQND